MDMRAWQAHLKCTRPAPLPDGWPDAQLELAISIVPVERGSGSWGDLPDQAGSPLSVLQSLLAVVEQHIPRQYGDHLQVPYSFQR